MINKFATLQQSLHNLASPAGEQIAYLIGTGVPLKDNPPHDLANIDELALDFEDATYLLRGLVESGKVSERARERIGELDRALLALSGEKNAPFWTIRARKKRSPLGRYPETRAGVPFGDRWRFTGNWRRLKLRRPSRPV